MALINEQELHNKSLEEIAGMMMIAARTAPKGRGRDNLFTSMITGDEIKKLAATMVQMGTLNQQEFFIRDAGNLAHAAAVVLIGARISTAGLSHCGFCGHTNCSGKEQFPQAPCAFNTIDLGIAVGSAVSVAAAHHADNRVMFSVGKAAMELRFLPAETRIAVGIPLAAMAKNPFFDRG